MPRRRANTERKIHGKTKPTEIKSAADRGLVFRFWLDEKGIKVGDFSAATKLGTTTLNRYFRGEIDLAGIDFEEANRLLRGMGISDSEAWDLLAIPEENRESFRSNRKPPMGSGPVDNVPESILLDEPLLGHNGQEAGVRIVLDSTCLEEGTQVIELSDGRLFSVRAAAVASVSGKRLGRLVAAYF